MRGMTLIVASGDVARACAALTLACTQAAAGGTAHVFFHEDAVALFSAAPDADSAGRAARGLPDRHALVALALETGVRLTVCQTGMALNGLSFADMPAGVAAGGMMHMLSQLGEDRLVFA